MSSNFSNDLCLIPFKYHNHRFLCGNDFWDRLKFSVFNDRPLQVCNINRMSNRCSAGGDLINVKNVIFADSSEDDISLRLQRTLFSGGNLLIFGHGSTMSTSSIYCAKGVTPASVFHVADYIKKIVKICRRRNMNFVIPVVEIAICYGADTTNTAVEERGTKRKYHVVDHNSFGDKLRAQIGNLATEIVVYAGEIGPTAGFNSRYA